MPLPPQMNNFARELQRPGQSTPANRTRDAGESTLISDPLQPARGHPRVEHDRYQCVCPNARHRTASVSSRGGFRCGVEMPIKDGLVLRICHGHACGRRSAQLETAVRDHIADKRLGDRIGVDREACFGRCFMGPNILVERWTDGQRNNQAMLSVMLGSVHPDMVYEHGVNVDDVPKLIRWHLRKWQRDRDSNAD